MTTIIVDTDFLCSLLKIGQSGLIHSFYTAASIRIPIAVYRELARTNLLAALLSIKWIEVDPLEVLPNETLLSNPTFRDLGSGEQACIILARATPTGVILMSDNQARAFAQSLGVTSGVFAGLQNRRLA